MKKIMIITNGFEGTGGGKMASIMENYLAEKYKTVTLVSFYDGGIFPIKGKKINIGTFGKNGFPGRGYIALIPHIINTIRYIKKETPDYVIGIGSYSNFLGLCAKRFCNFKLLLTQHEHLSTQKTYVGLLEKFIIFTNGVLIGDNKIVAVSNVVKNDLLNVYKHLTPDNVTTIHNGLDIDNILKLSKERINISEKYIITIGTLDSNKNQELIIRAYNESKLKGDYSLYILGEGEKKQYLKNLIKSLNLEGKVKLLGYKKNPYKYLANASLFCFASKSESFGLVLAEALLMGLPIITTPIPSANEVLGDGKYGLILSDYSIEKYIEGMDYFYKSNKIINNDPQSYVTNNFGLKKMMDDYLSLLKKI